MSLLLTIKLALSNIRTNKLRSALTMLGLIIGIASVIILVGIGKGATESVTNEMSGLGADLLTVSIYDGKTTIAYNDLDDFLKLPNIEAIAPYKSLSANINRGNVKLENFNLLATNQNYLGVMGYDLGEGRPLSEIDIENSTKAVIIGNSIAEKLFNLTDPLGKTIKINGDDYTVVGTLAAGSSMSEVDNILLVPLTTAKYLGSNTAVSELYLKANNAENVDGAAKEVKSYVETNYKIDSDSLNVYTNTGILESMKEVSAQLSLLLGGIAGISLIVGGIGIMNVMLVSVTERTKEIGIRKSLGAKRRDISKQFLIESLVLSLLGGIIGILTGIGCGALTNALVAYLGYSNIFALSPGVVVLSFSVSAAVGLIFGSFPSYRAACLRPIDALKQE